jgi:hypothetical protein
VYGLYADDAGYASEPGRSSDHRGLDRHEHRGCITGPHGCSTVHGRPIREPWRAIQQSGTPLQFVPRQEVRTIRPVPSDRRYSQTIVTQVLPLPGSAVEHLRIPVFPFSEFIGEKGDDEFLSAHQPAERLGGQ